MSEERAFSTVERLKLLLALCVLGAGKGEYVKGGGCVLGGVLGVNI
jgi:hypothetical protein